MAEPTSPHLLPGLRLLCHAQLLQYEAYVFAVMAAEPADNQQRQWWYSSLFCLGHQGLLITPAVPAGAVETATFTSQLPAHPQGLVPPRTAVVQTVVINMLVTPLPVYAMPPRSQQDVLTPVGLSNTPVAGDGTPISTGAAEGAGLLN